MSSLNARSDRNALPDAASLNDAPAARLDLQVGALVVYGGHGVGRVSHLRDGSPGSVVLEFADGLSVTLPLDRATACLRSVADENQLGRIRDTLRQQDAEVESSWQERARSTRTKIASGEAIGLAEVVRDSVLRQRLSSNGTLSTHERELYLKARRLLAAELGAARETDEVQAEAWITGQLEPAVADGAEPVSP